MSKEAKKEIFPDREWMDYYEKLFREKNPVKARPLLVKGAREQAVLREAQRN